jgi:hypothetical protein
MLSAFMAIFGALGGGLLRLAPVLIDAWLNRNATSDAIELARIELEKSRVEAEAVTLRATLPEAQANANAALAQANATLAALAAQRAEAEAAHPFAQPAAPPRPNRWLEALSLAVRPAITLWLLGLYTAYKAMLFAIALMQHTPFADMATVIWNDDDITIFSDAVSFWFIDQAINDSKAARKRR